MARTHRIAPLLGGLFLAAGTVVVAPLASASAVPPVAEAFTGSIAFTYTGAPETWTVPVGVTSIVVTTCGASGENLLIGGEIVKFGGKPGHGGCVTANVLVSPGDVVNVRVGGHPRDDGLTSSTAWPDGGRMDCPGLICGGGGGGSSDIRIGGDTLADRVLVGGGGGGGGAGALGGAGGNAGGGSGTLDGFGGNGGPAVGMTAPELEIMGGGGGAFDQEWNGGCGIVDGANLTPNCAHSSNPSWVYPPGLRGVANEGGDSSLGNKLIGGAGGGGYFGGGSGCSYSEFGSAELGSCGGGGGSSYADPTRTDNVQFSQSTTQWYLDFLAGITTEGDDGTVTIRWPGPAVVITTTTLAATTTTLAATTTALATTTTDIGAGGGGLPATGSRNSSLPTAAALFGVGVLLTLVTRRAQPSRT